VRTLSSKTISWTLSALVALATAAVAQPAPARGFRVEAVAPGVFALVRTKPPGMLLDCNVLLIVNDDDVVVVDANLTPTSAAASIAALREITSKPVSLIVDTHRHADHTTGNGVWKEAFPKAEIAASAAMRADLAELGEKTLAGWTGWAAEMATELPKALAEGKTLGGNPMNDELRASYEGDLAAAREIVADTPRMKVTPPTLEVGEAGLTLQRGARTIEIRSLGKAHTRGDLVVWLPAEGVVATGDVVVAPVPLVGADQSFPEEWIATLDRLLELKPKVIVPGHGPVMRDDAYVKLYREFFVSAVAQTKAAMARGESADQAVQSVDLASFRDRMAGESPVLRFLFANWGRVPVVQALYRVRDEVAAAKP